MMGIGIIEFYSAGSTNKGFAIIVFHLRNKDTLLSETNYIKRETL
jgi:uncharacterized protein YbcI